MEINENLAKLIFREFDDSIKGTDIYNHDGSMWLIFTEERKWVVEFTNQKTLWYNYKHFTDILVLFGMEVSDGAEYIKKWYEDKFIFKPKIVDDSIKDRIFFVEDTIENGAKEVKSVYIRSGSGVGDAIQYGVKNTDKWADDCLPRVVDAIQNGVKNIYGNKHYTALGVENTIQNGVKHTEWNGSDLPTHKIEDAIQNGVKETKTMVADRIPLIKKVFQNGVKEVEYYDGDAEILVNDAIENGVKEVMDGTMQVFLISDIIKKGVKIVDYHILESMEQKDHSVTTLDFTEKIKDTIENGVKEISSVDCEYPRATENVINNGVKYMMSGSEFKNNQVEDVIKYSEKLKN